MLEQRGRTKIKLGVVGHFSLAVSDPGRSARFWTSSFDLREQFRFEEGIAVGNEAITLVLFKGRPNPEVLDHMSFHLQTMQALKEAVTVLKQQGVEMEDPGDEIGPEAPGSPNMGLWFHDPDGYRWELSVQGGANEH